MTDNRSGPPVAVGKIVYFAKYIVLVAKYQTLKLHAAGSPGQTSFRFIITEFAARPERSGITEHAVHP
jgi:hypothetical protein